MGLKQDITDKVQNIIDVDFNITDVSSVPDISNTKLTFGNTGLRFDATVLYIDMRGSTQILNKHHKYTVAKMHMAYFHTIVKIANSLGGEVRSFNGDSMLVFFPGDLKSMLNNAVKAAMQMKYMISHKDGGINNLLSKYSALDFGIGIDFGSILSTKIGVGGNSNNQDLMWIGNAVNKATVLSERRLDPNHIGISRYVYDNLEDNLKYGFQNDPWGKVSKVDMWTYQVLAYNNNSEVSYYTGWWWAVE